jgi:hypothetical protein
MSKVLQYPVNNDGEYFFCIALIQQMLKHRKSIILPIISCTGPFFGAITDVTGNRTIFNAEK